ALADTVAGGEAAGRAAAERAGFVIDDSSDVTPENDRMVVEPLWVAPSTQKRAKAFVDMQTDVTVADIAISAREGYQSVEHLKRYTTLGMGTDQGKTSNVVGLALMAEQLGVS